MFITIVYNYEHFLMRNKKNINSLAFNYIIQLVFL